MTSQTITVEICNLRGLHARAAAKFAKLAATFDASIDVHRAGQTVGGTSIMGLMMLAAAKGCTIDITADGTDAAKAIAALRDLVEGAFEEE